MEIPQNTYPTDKIYSVNTVLLMNMLNSFCKPNDWEEIDSEEQMKIMEKFIKDWLE